LRIVALSSDLMDRSKLSAAIDGIAFARDVGECDEADVVIVDLARYADAVGALRAALPDARIIAFGPHVDEDAVVAARAAGADLVWPRSRFFRDPPAALGERTP
jgi:DNA-binding NarL/FixJ family response regulator